MADPYLSVVVPVFNEEDSIQTLTAEIIQSLDRSGLDYEVIYVNDGSRDATGARLDEIRRSQPRLRVLHLAANVGQSGALYAGMHAARGRVLASLDGDGQNDPADIPRLLAMLDARPEVDIISGWRRHRQDKALMRKFPSKIANRLISAVTGVRLHDYGCSLKAYRREVLRDVRLYGEMHRYIPALARWAGGSVAEVVVTHHPRRFGRSKYGLSRITRVLLDLFTVKFLLAYSTKPIQVFGRWGLTSGAIGFLLALYLSIEKLAFGVSIGNRPLLLLAVLLMILGVQFITMGLLAELQARTYYEAQDKRIYAIRRVTRREDEAASSGQ
jgi:glycosyltransferase involved in cell wall biosynthesis